MDLSQLEPHLKILIGMAFLVVPMVIAVVWSRFIKPTPIKEIKEEEIKYSSEDLSHLKTVVEALEELLTLPKKTKEERKRWSEGIKVFDDLVALHEGLFSNHDFHEIQHYTFCNRDDSINEVYSKVVVDIIEKYKQKYQNKTLEETA